MYCTNCNKHVANCTCPDIAERLAALRGASHVATQYCRRCNQHHSRCQCAEPDFVVQVGETLRSIVTNTR